MEKITVKGLSFYDEVSLNRDQLKNVLGGTAADGTEDPSGCATFHCTCRDTTGTWDGYYCSTDDMATAIFNYCSGSGGTCTNVG